MGAGGSWFQGTVEVALERGQYRAGDVVKGYVLVQAHGMMECTDLIVNLNGETRTCAAYNESVTKEKKVGDGPPIIETEQIPRKAWQRQTFVTETRYIARFMNSMLPPGTYEFPFEFQLHSALPSSVFVEPGVRFNEANTFEESHASIMYGVEVQLTRPGFLQPTLGYKTAFDLISQVPRPITPAYTIDKQAVNCCCCIGKGSITLSAALQFNAFRANEMINVRIQMNNESETTVSGIVVEVLETVHIAAMGKHATRFRVIAEVKLPESILPKGGFGEAFGTEPQFVSIRLPPFNHCTLKSQLLTITHSVRVRADTPFGITNPSIDLPVTLHRSDVVQAAFAPPRHEGEDVDFAPAIAYNPNPNAMQSPIAMDSKPSAPVAPQGFEGEAPPPQQMMAQQAMQQQGDLKQPLLPAAS